MQDLGVCREVRSHGSGAICALWTTKTWQIGRLWNVLTFLFTLASINLVQPSARAFDRHADWFPPALVTIRLPVGEPIAVAAGDFNADGVPDLFLITDVNRPNTFFGVPSPDYVVRFYLLYGQDHGWGEPVPCGTFPAPERYLFSRAIASGMDLDGDGNQDAAAILTLAPGSPAALDLDNLQSYLIIFWGQDHGGFAIDHTDVDVGLLPPTSIVHGDFNGDGLVDLAYPDSQNLAIHVVYNRGERRLSCPHLVEVATEEDECILLPTKLGAARLDPAREGDDIVVMLGPCVLDQGNYKQSVRFVSSCGEDCWELSPLLPTGPVRGDFAGVLGDLMIGDFDADQRMDVIFTQRLFLQRQEEASVPLPTAMGVYLLRGGGREEFREPVFIGGMLWGGLLAIERDGNGFWTIVAFSGEVNGVAVLHINKGDGGYTSTSIPVRGYATDGVLIQRGDRRKIVVVSSLDLRSGITLLNVVTRRSP